MNKKQETKKLLSFVLSLFIHFCILLIILFWGLFCSEEKPPVKEAPPSVVLDLSPDLTQKKEAVTLAPEHPLEKAPQHATAESYENSIAASELPPSGTANLPSQEGREQKALEFKNQQHTLGEKPLTSGAAPSSPENIEKEALSSLEKPAPLHEQASPTPLPSATPDAKIASSSPTPTPTPDQPVMGKLSPAAQAQGYQPETTTSVIHGSISNKGKAAITTEATPIGRYKKNLSDAIGSRWYYYVDERMGLLTVGTASITFYVNKEGHVEGLRVLSNSSNQTFADCSIKSITEAKLPEIPPEVAKTLQHGRLEIEYSFTIY